MSVSRHLRWPCAVAGGLLALTWFFSLPFNITIAPWGHTINLCNGGVDCVVNAGAPSHDWSVEANSPDEPMRWGFGWRVYSRSPVHIRLRVPVWSGLALAAWCAWGAWRSQVRHAASARAGRCAACGYELKGSPAGKCPECGLAIKGARA